MRISLKSSGYQINKYQSNSKTKMGTETQNRRRRKSNAN